MMPDACLRDPIMSTFQIGCIPIPCVNLGEDRQKLGLYLSEEFGLRDVV